MDRTGPHGGDHCACSPSKHNARAVRARQIAYHRRAPELFITGSEGKEVDVCIFTVKSGRDFDQPSISCLISHRWSMHLAPCHSVARKGGQGIAANGFQCQKAYRDERGFQDWHHGRLTARGELPEASAANFFAIRDRCVFTPPLNPDVFPGVTRRGVIGLAPRRGDEVIERDLYPEDLDQIDGAFPVLHVDGESAACRASASARWERWSCPSSGPS